MRRRVWPRAAVVSGAAPRCSRRVRLWGLLRPAGGWVLHLARKKLDQQTIEIKQCTEQLRALPETVVEQMQSSVDEIKERLKIGWRVFSFIRRQRKKRKLKKRMMSR